MRRAYSLGSGRENVRDLATLSISACLLHFNGMLITAHTIIFSQSAASVSERLESAGHRKEEGEDEEIELEEEEAVDLYKWSQELSFDDLS